MPVLSGPSIERLCLSSGKLRADAAIKSFVREQVKTGSYDMRLGQKYIPGYRDGDKAPDVRALALGQYLRLAANEVVLVEMEEELALPDYVVGHLTLKVNVLLRGVIIASQSQIDAGYKGRIFALLYNLSSQEVSLERLQPILRLELATLDEKVAPYGGSMTERPLSTDLLPNGPFASGLAKLNARFEDYSRKTRRDIAIAVLASALALVLGVSGVMATVITPFADKAQAAREQVDTQKIELDKLRASNDQLRARVETLERGASAKTS